MLRCHVVISFHNRCSIDLNFDCYLLPHRSIFMFQFFEVYLHVWKSIAQYWKIFRRICKQNINPLAIRSQHYLLLFQFFKFETTIKITILLLQFLPILSTIIKFLNLPFDKFLKHKSISLLHQTLKDPSLIFFIFTTLSTIFHIDWIYSNNLRSGGFKRLWSQCQRTRIDLKPVSHRADSFHIVRITCTVGKSRDTRRGDGRV